jgi:hypothetical protein
MTPFNDNRAFLDGGGNLTLGTGQDDASNHATYTYAKDDVTLSVPGFLLVSDTQPAMTYITGDIPVRTLAASTTHKVAIPLTQFFNRMYTGIVNPEAQSAPHGIMVKSLALAYRVNTTTITSFATMTINTAPLVAAAALPTVVALTSTLAGNTLTAAANVYLAVSTVTTPAFQNIADNQIWAVATIVTPGSSTVDLLGASWRVAYAMY